MHITIPEFSLVLLIGASGSGKSTFAAKHFAPTEVVSSDHCRALVSDDPDSLEATADAFDLLHFLCAKRLQRRRLTVIDATNVQREARASLIALARSYHALPVAIVLELSDRICMERNGTRTDRSIPEHAIRKQWRELRRSISGLRKEGIRHIHRLSSAEEVESAEIERSRIWSDRRDENGPFDLIGDVHGCCDELELLLKDLGYEREEILEGDRDAGSARYPAVYRHPEGRKAVFVGDLVDRGPRILDSLMLVRNMVNAGTGICVPGNHDTKLLRMLRGKNVQVRHGLEQSVAELDALPKETRERLIPVAIDFIDGMISHYVMDGGSLVVAHAGMKEEMQGRASAAVRDFALFGETTGESDEYGLPIRHNWAAEYRGKATVVYGHTPVPDPEWLNNTINIDTGCVFGGKLTALRYPERELRSVPAARVYSDPIRPMEAPEPNQTAQQEQDTLLDIEDVLGKRFVETELAGGVTIREENGAAALEVMSRFAVDPRWLIYLPPTMSPVKTSDRPDLLEHPDQAFEYYRSEGVERVVCQEKHMGSRAVVVLCRNREGVISRFGDVGSGIGVIYTRTGRRFFRDADLDIERALLDHLNRALEDSGFWNDFNTDWVCLDCELMPWSAKAQELLTGQYAAVGAAASAGLAEALTHLTTGRDRGLEVDAIIDRFTRRAGMINQFRTAYGRYCWPVSSAEDFLLAPFHIMATEGAVHTDRDHLWHMKTIASFADENRPLFVTRHRVVDLNDEESCAAGVAWWEELTETGGEGMVVKPFDFVHRNGLRISQPAVKVRGREYLRIIYGPEYSTPEHLEGLRGRGLSAKRSLASREFALGIEGLRRFVQRRPLRQVHEAVFGVLALESTPVDPRL